MEEAFQLGILCSLCMGLALGRPEVPDALLKKDSRYSALLCDPDSGLYFEEYFSDLLCLERKRTERSKKPFLLMKMDITGVPEKSNRTELISTIARMLLSVTRETDTRGWLKEDCTIGVIFTEINISEAHPIKQKITNNLCSILDSDVLDKIRVSFHIFPEEQAGREAHEMPDESFYPDLERWNSSRKGLLIIKRVVDIIGSLIAMVIFLPFFLVIPVLIKLSSRGPVLFRQERVGLFGEKFIFLKFRTMYANSDQNVHQEYVRQFICEQKCAIDGENGNGQRVYKLAGDSRVTPIGKFLRKTSLDEIPQFFNVLKGEMSLVGPRPPIPYELQNYDIWHRRRVLEVKPGITGLWQVSGRSRTTFDEMVRLDLKYTLSWSLWLDVQILFRTVWVVLTGKGGY